jgi:NADPH:quinone reductase-like Zn-dependent oxidoreductase
VVVKQDDAALAPPNLPTEEAGALGADGVTALIGLEDKLKLREGENLLIYGASGGVGHLAVQLAKRIGARVLAVASGPDGVRLVRSLGADIAIDGKQGDLSTAVQEFAPDGLDAALVLVSGKALKQALAEMKKGGRLAYPNGVEPEPKAKPGVKAIAYDGVPSPDVFKRLNALIAAGPFHVELGKTYALQDASRAHQDLNRHYLGKLALRIHAH